MSFCFATCGPYMKFRSQCVTDLCGALSNCQQYGASPGENCNDWCCETDWVKVLLSILGLILLFVVLGCYIRRRRRLAAEAAAAVAGQPLMGTPADQPAPLYGDAQPAPKQAAGYY
jgi:hypothetical protein